jgi:acyl dehydratase
MRTFNTLADLAACVGQDVGVSPWHTITQAQIDAFAAATLDAQWIHVDPVRAREGPFQSTIAHGFLTLSLVPRFLAQSFEVQEASTAINCGLNKVRFTSVVPVNAQLRARFHLAAAQALLPQEGRGYALTWDVTFELNAQDKPACVAQCIVRHYH